MKNTSTSCFKSSNSSSNKHEKMSIKKAPGSRSKQSGFFDLGISLLVLTMSGSAAYVIERNQDERTVSLQESTEITASQKTENSNLNVARTDFDNPGPAPQ